MQRSGPSELHRAERGIGVPAHDGVRLATDVLWPDDGDRHPCLLQRVPYDRTHHRIVNNALDVTAAVGRGYAVVTQDCRGRFGSEGTFRPFLDEADDGAATVEWIVSQPWSDGTVGLIGRSYSALNQWLLAARDLPQVKAMAPFLSGPDPAADWFKVGPAFEWGFAVLWGLRYLLPDLVARRGGTGLDMERLIGELDEVGTILWEPDVDLLEGAAALLPALSGWLRAAERPAAMRALSELAPAAEEVGTPTFVIGGWHDLFLSGCLDAYERLPAGARRLLVGPWPHGGMNSGVFPERSFGVRASGDAVGLTGRQLDWFDRWLRPGDHDDEAGTPVRVFVMGEDRWRDLDSWPPVDAAPAVLNLDTASGPPGWDGRLRRAAAPSGTAALAYDEDAPVPTRGGPTFLPGLEVAANAGPRDQRDVLGRVDVLTFVGQELETPLAVTGAVELVLRLRGLRPSMRVVARLVDVEPDGRVMLVVEGAGGAPAELDADGSAVVRLRVGATSWRFGPAHRIGLVLAHTSHPRFHRSIDGGAAAGRSGTTVVVSGGDAPSRLLLPVVERGSPPEST